MHSVQCTMYSVQYPVHSVQCTVHIAQCTVHIVQCTMHTAQCTVHNVQYTVHTAQCTVHGVQCADTLCRATAHGNIKITIAALSRRLKQTRASRHLHVQQTLKMMPTRVSKGVYPIQNNSCDKGGCYPIKHGAQPKRYVTQHEGSTWKLS